MKKYYMSEGSVPKYCKRFYKSYIRDYLESKGLQIIHEMV